MSVAAFSRGKIRLRSQLPRSQERMPSRSTLPPRGVFIAGICSPPEDSRPTEARSLLDKPMSSPLPTVHFVMPHRLIHRIYPLPVPIASAQMEGERQPSISRVRVPFLPISPYTLFPQ